MNDVDISNTLFINEPVQYAEGKMYKPKNKKMNQYNRKSKKTKIPKGGGGRRFLSKEKYE